MKLNRIFAPGYHPPECSECGKQLKPNQKCYQSGPVCPACARQLLQGKQEECIHQQAPTRVPIFSPNSPSSVDTPPDKVTLQTDPNGLSYGVVGTPNNQAAGQKSNLEPQPIDNPGRNPRCGACGAPLIYVYYRKGRGGLGGLEKVGMFCRWCGQPYITIDPVDSTCVKRRSSRWWEKLEAPQHG